MRFMMAMVLAFAMHSQSASTADGPIAVRDVSFSAHPNGSEFVCSISNVGSKPIRAYAVVLGVFRDGRPIGAFTQIGVPGPGKFFNPGQSHKVSGFIIKKKDAAAPDFDYRAIVDYVLFADGSEWGADVHKGSVRVAKQLKALQLRHEQAQPR